METNLSLQNTQNFVNDELEEHIKNSNRYINLFQKLIN